MKREPKTKIIVLRVSIILAMFLSCELTYSQQRTFFGVRNSMGYLMAHRPSMRHLQTGHAHTLELNFFKEVDGSKRWHNLLNIPRTGFALYRLNSGNSEVIGAVTSLYGFLDFPVIRKNNFSGYFKFGSGVTHVQKNFNRLDNYTNVAVGSSFNLGFVFSQNIECQIDKFNFGLGLSIVHASTGAFTLPNLGINFGSIDFTIGYLLDDVTSNEKEMQTDELKSPKWHFDVLLSSGPREVEAVTRKKHFVHTLQLDAVKDFSFLLSYSAGIDLFYNNAIAKLDDEIDSSDPITQVGGKLGIHMNLDKASIYLQSGTYLVSESKFLGEFYNRFGGRYLYQNKYLFNFSLKTHGARADYFELGLGYRIL